MGKFFPKPPRVAAAPVTKSEEEVNVEEDKAADRLRSAEKRRRGRRGSILSKTSEEEALAANVERPEGRAAKILFGG